MMSIMIMMQISILRRVSGVAQSLNARETAPADAREDMYVNDTEKSTLGMEMDNTYYPSIQAGHI